MRLALLLVFIAVPLLEIALLIKVGEQLGLWTTLAIVIGTAIVGTSIMHRQGLQALTKAQNSLAGGKIPLDSVVDGAFLLAAGLFLLTPGLLTDSVGFLFLVPPFRRWAARWGFRKIVTTGKARSGEFADMGGSPDDPPRQRSPDRGQAADGGVIDGDFERLDETTIDPRRGR